MTIVMIEPEQIYGNITSDIATMIFGKDFTAMNYGKHYGAEHWGHHRIIAISGTSRSYMSTTAENLFPIEVYFQRQDANMRIPDATHVPGYLAVHTTMTLDEIVNILQIYEGMHFPEEPPEEDPIVEITDDDPTEK